VSSQDAVQTQLSGPPSRRDSEESILTTGGSKLPRANLVTDKRQRQYSLSLSQVTDKSEEEQWCDAGSRRSKRARRPKKPFIVGDGQVADSEDEGGSTTTVSGRTGQAQAGYLSGQRREQTGISTTNAPAPSSYPSNSSSTLQGGVGLPWPAQLSWSTAFRPQVLQSSIPPLPASPAACVRPRVAPCPSPTQESLALALAFVKSLRVVMPIDGGEGVGGGGVECSAADDVGRKAEHLLVRLREAEKAISPPHQLYHTLPWLRERVPFFYRAGGGLSAPMPPQGGGLLVPKLVSEEGLPGGTCAHTTEAAREGPGDGTVVAQEE